MVRCAAVLAGGLERGVEVADILISFEERGKAAAEHGFSWIFVELRKRLRLGKIQAGLVVSGADEFYGVFLAGAGTDAHAMECEFALRPVLAEKA